MDVQLFGKANEVCKGMGTHLLHYAGSMHLDGFFGNSKVEGNLLVQHATGHKPKNLSFPRS
jgi:hypothetical protein